MLNLLSFCLITAVNANVGYAASARSSIKPL